MAPQNRVAFILCPAKLWSNAYFAPQNHGDIVSWVKMTTEIFLKLDFFLFSNYFCKSMLFQRSIQPLGPVLKEKNIFCVRAPLIGGESFRHQQE